MSALLTAFNAVAPILLLVSIGSAVRKMGVVSAQTMREMNRICYHVFYAALCFNSVYACDLRQALEGGTLELIVFCAAGTLLFYGAARLLGPLLCREPTRQSVFNQSFFRTNLLVIGYPIILLLYQDTAMAGILFAVLIPLNNTLGVATFERLQPGRTAGMRAPLSRLLAVLRSPVVSATLAGIAVSLLKLPVFSFLSSTLKTLGNAGSAMGLIILGSFFSFDGGRGQPDHGRGRRKLLAAACVIRLLLVPLLAVGAALLLRFRGLRLLCVLISFASPCSTLVFTMAQELGADDNFACDVVVYTTAFSCLTLFLWVFVLRSAGLI